jgi:hypothetical protein
MTNSAKPVDDKGGGAFRHNGLRNPCRAPTLASQLGATRLQHGQRTSARATERTRQFRRRCGNYGIDSPNERRQIETTGRQSRELFRPVAARRARSRRHASGVGMRSYDEVEMSGVSQVYRFLVDADPLAARRIFRCTSRASCRQKCLLYAAAVCRRTTVTVDPMATPRLRQHDRSRSLQGRGRGTPAPTRR